MLEAKVLVGVMAHQQRAEPLIQRTWTPTRNLSLPVHELNLNNYYYYGIRMLGLPYSFTLVRAVLNPSFCHFSPCPDDDTQMSVETLD